MNPATSTSPNWHPVVSSDPPKNSERLLICTRRSLERAGMREVAHPVLSRKILQTETFSHTLYFGITSLPGY